MSSTGPPRYPFEEAPRLLQVLAADWPALLQLLTAAGFRVTDVENGPSLCRRGPPVVAASVAGVAHEVSNPLTAVLANLELALSRLEAGVSDPASWVPELRAELEDAHAAASHVNQLLRAVRSIGHPDADTPHPVDVGEIIDVALRMASNEIKTRARLVRQGGETPLVLGSALRLGQVFLNLLLNAAQAIEEGMAEAHEIRVLTGTNDQGWAVIAISDNGVGIPPANLGRVSAPFFTTKPEGVGSGLGLPISQRIVDELGGRIELVSQEGVGTTVTVYLPPAPRR